MDGLLLKLIGFQQYWLTALGWSIYRLNNKKQKKSKNWVDIVLMDTQQKNTNSAMGLHVDEAVLKDNFSGLVTPQCRICLISDYHQNLISPCNCSGSLEFVHSACIQSWINTFLSKSKDKVKGKKAHVYCELCKGKISFTVSKRTECKSKQQICEKIDRKTKTFVALLALAFINLCIFLAILGYIISSQGFSKTKSQALLYPLSIAGEVIFSIVVISSLLILTKKFFLNKKFVVCQFVPGEVKDQVASKKTHENNS